VFWGCRGFPSRSDSPRLPHGRPRRGPAQPRHRQLLAPRVLAGAEQWSWGRPCPCGAAGGRGVLPTAPASPLKGVLGRETTLCHVCALPRGHATRLLRLRGYGCSLTPRHLAGETEARHNAPCPARGRPSLGSSAAGGPGRRGRHPQNTRNPSGVWGPGTRPWGETQLLKVKGSGAEARAEGPFLQWQNRSGEAAKSAERERGDPSPPPSGKAGSANERQLCLSGRGVECDSGQTPARVRAAPRERERPEPANRAGAAARERRSGLRSSLRSSSSGEGDWQGAAAPAGNSSRGHRLSRRYSSHGYQPWESCCSKECGDPDGGPHARTRVSRSLAAGRA